MRTDRYGGFGAFLHPRVAAMFFLGFSAGLPFPLVFSTLTAWLADVGVNRGTVGMLAWVGLAYTLKIFWAPLVDTVRLPLLHRMLGRRRSWMLLAQFGVICGLLLLAGTNPGANIYPVAVFALLAAFSGATQDIAMDAWRIEAVEVERQAAMAASYQYGYRVAMLVSTAGALYLAEFYSWSVSYLTMAACMGVGVVTVILVAEPVRRSTSRAFAGSVGWLRATYLEPLLDIVGRYGRYALAILAFVGLFRVSDYVMGSMAMPFYLDMGYTKVEIANITKIYGTAATLAGTMAGGLLVGRFGLRAPLILSTILLPVTNLAFASVAASGESNLWLLGAVVTADNLAMGMSGTAFIAFLSNLTSRNHTATQYALLTSLMALPGKLMSGGSGFLSLEVGWVNFYVLVCLAGLPAILLAIYVTRLKFFDRVPETSPAQ
ncbi:AmpG family muropeptide MFS transporter [Candidatus Foliamicus sp.]